MAGWTVLLDALNETEEDSPFGQVTRLTLSGEPHRAAIVGAVVETYPRARIDWDDLVGKKVTLLHHGQNAFGSPGIGAMEARIFPGSRGPAYLPKGRQKKGYRVDEDGMLDVIEGYGGIEEMRRRLTEVRDQLPQLVPLTQDRLAQLPRPGWATDEDYDGSSPECTLGVFGHWDVLGSDTYRALWVLNTYEPENDIAEGVLYVPESVGESEHGSVYGKQLLAMGGEVVNFRPVSFGDAVRYASGDYATAVGTLL